MFKLIVFDWDGTLMDSEAKIVASARAASADLSMPPLAPERVRNIIGLGLREAVECLYPDGDEDFYRQFVERYRYHFLVGDQTPMPLFAGAGDTLNALCDQGYMLAVATGKSRRGLDRVLDETGLRRHFLASRCADEAPSKPHPRMLEELMEELGVAGNETLMVGDTEYDLQMARNAGTRAVGVSYGVHGRERLLQFAPLACLDDISELTEWLWHRHVV